MKAFVVFLHTFDWCFLRHVCKTRETALKHWEEIRLECVEQNDRMIEYCNKQTYTNDVEDWEKRNEILRGLKPGERPENDESWDCDEFPTIEEWEVE